MRRIRYVKRTVSLITICVLFLLVGGSSRGHYAYYLMDWDHVCLVAHRGGAIQAPENTCIALQQAIEAGLPMAEIDVQMTRDGAVIVMHDDSFLRTAGMNRKVWETDYETVQILDAGLHHSQQYSGEAVPSLEEMMELARGRILLMIELKSYGYADQLVASVLQLIDQYDMADQCLIASMDLELLKQSQSLAPQLTTVFITSKLPDLSPDLSFVDSYSIKHTALTQAFIDQVHEEGKTVYAWTINNKKAALQALAMEVDGIITDDLWLEER